jgi:hypothetical protein
MVVQMMHTFKKEKRKLRKTKRSSYGIPALTTTIQPPPRQHLNSRLFKSDAFKKEQGTSTFVA